MEWQVYVFIGVIFGVLAYVIHHAYDAKEEATDVLYTALREDYEHTARNIQWNVEDSDWYIDQFEHRWVSYLTHKELQFYIGKLISHQIQNV